MLHRPSPLTLAPLVAPALAPMRPTGLGWLFVRKVRAYQSMADLWWHAGADTSVVSELAMAELPRSGRTGPQWHMSVSDRSGSEPRRPSAPQVLLARCAFGMLTAEEDNHRPGHTRSFWLPVDPSERVDCECKTDETVVREADGFEWTNPVDGPCRGCEHERDMAGIGLNRPCPLHAAGGAGR